MATGHYVFLFNTAFVLLGAYLALKDRMFSPKQMIKRGFPQGLPFVFHLGMWGDLVLGVVFDHITDYYSDFWSFKDLSIAMCAGFAVSGIMHKTYLGIKHPEAHVHGGHFTPAGIVQIMYMGFALGLIFMFYFASPIGPRNERMVMLLISLVLWFHLWLGTHAVLGIINRFTKFEWYADKPLRNRATWGVIGGGFVALAGASLYAIYAG